MRYKAKPIVVEAIRYNGANWREVAVTFLGLNEEFDQEDMRWNIYPSLQLRTSFLHVPQDLRDPDPRNALSILPDSWVVVYDGERVENMTDREFHSRFVAEEEPVSLHAAAFRKDALKGQG